MDGVLTDLKKEYMVKGRNLGSGRLYSDLSELKSRAAEWEKHLTAHLLQDIIPEGIETRMKEISLMLETEDLSSLTKELTQRMRFYKPFFDHVNRMDFTALNGSIRCKPTNLERMVDCVVEQHRVHGSNRSREERTDLYYKSCLENSSKGVEEEIKKALDLLDVMNGFDFFYMDHAFAFETFKKADTRYYCQTRSYYGRVEKHMNKKIFANGQWESWCEMTGICRHAHQSQGYRFVKDAAMDIELGKLMPKPRNLGFLLEFLGMRGTPNGTFYTNWFENGDPIISPEEVVSLFKKRSNGANSTGGANSDDRRFTGKDLGAIARVLKNNLYMPANLDREFQPRTRSYPQRNLSRGDYFEMIYPLHNEIGEFRPILTDTGMCEAYNARPASEVFAMDSFVEMFVRDFEDNSEEELVNISSKNYVPRSVWLNIPGPGAEIQVSIGDWLSSFSMVTNGFRVYPGTGIPGHHSKS